MTTVAFVFLTLLSWMVSSGTRLGPDPRPDPGQHGTDEEAKVFGSGASCINAVIHKKANLTHTCESCMNLLQTSKETLKQSERVCKREIQQPVACSLSKAGCVLRRTKTHSHSVVSASHCCCVIARGLVNSWATADRTFEVTSLPMRSCRQFGAAVPKLFIPSGSQVRPMSSEKSKKARVGVCCQQKWSVLYVTDAFLTQAGRIKLDAHAGGAGGLWVTLTSRWAQRLFLAAVLLLGIHVTKTKLLPNRVSGSNATIAILCTMTFHSFSPPLTPGWSRVAAEISFAACLSCALGRAVHTLLACRLCPTQQKFRVLPVTALLFWLTFRPSFPNKGGKDCPEDVLAESSEGSSLKSWAVLRQLELLVTLYCMFVSLPCLLQSIVTKLNFLSVFLHVQLVTCLQNTRVPIKYVLVIRINRVI